jgi:lysophospholipase L1-like esterase
MQENLHALHAAIQIVNEGQNGWTVTDVSQHVENWLRPVSPDIILLQIGTNDLEQGATPEEAAGRLDLLLTQIQSFSPQSHFYVANCTPMKPDNKPQLSLNVLAQFNDLVPRIVRQHEHHGHFIVFVDLNKRVGFTATDLGPDGEHPDNAGYQKLANYWTWELRHHEFATLR